MGFVQITCISSFAAYINPNINSNHVAYLCLYLFIFPSYYYFLCMFCIEPIFAILLNWMVIYSMTVITGSDLNFDTRDPPVQHQCTVNAN